MGIGKVIGYPLGLIIGFLYNVTQSYVVALILFTLITKIVFLPFAVNQQKSSLKMAAIDPKLKKLQKQYANDKEKLAYETMKLYKEEKYNPIVGCLPTLIQLPFLFGLTDVVYKPLTYMLKISKNLISKSLEIANGVSNITNSQRAPEILIVNSMKEFPEKFFKLSRDVVFKVVNFDVSFCGIDLFKTPELKFNLLLIIPIISVVTSLLLALQNNKNMEYASSGKNSKYMLLLWSIPSVYFSFALPASIGLYWTLSNIFSIVQTYFLNKLYNIKDAINEGQKMLAKQEVLEAVDVKESSKQISQKELDRLRLVAARKRDLEKYSEEIKEMDLNSKSDDK
jgi:YidC/Oxa1 family membrane protein insertase